MKYSLLSDELYNKYGGYNKFFDEFDNLYRFFVRSLNPTKTLMSIENDIKELGFISRLRYSNVDSPSVYLSKDDIVIEIDSFPFDNEVLVGVGLPPDSNDYINNKECIILEGSDDC